MKQESSHPLLAWENSRAVSEFLKAFLPLCGSILFKPVDFFRQLIRAGDADSRKRITRALLFALILGYLKLFFDIVNIYWLKYFSKDVFPVLFQWQVSSLSTAVLSSPLFFLRPILIFILTLAFVVAGVKLILGFDKAIIPVLFVVCYKSVADIFYGIPMIGSFFAALWSLALITIGIREVYAINTLRAVFSAVVTPFMIFFFIILSMGPSLNKIILNVYPETQVQIMKLNEVTAYMETTSIVSATKEYKKELGFYPSYLGVLKKYLSGAVADDVIRERHTSGYAYSYNLADDNHFVVLARPIKVNDTGRFVFYADETGKIRLNDRDGLWIQSLKDMESLMGDHREAGGVR